MLPVFLILALNSALKPAIGFGGSRFRVPIFLTDRDLGDPGFNGYRLCDEHRELGLDAAS